MKKILIFILIPILLATCGEFLLKHTINALPPTDNVIGLMGYIKPFFNPLILLSIITIVSGGVLWLVAMSRFELSFLYPFLSINYIAVVLGSQWVLDEKVVWTRYVAIGLIMVGLIIISRSPYSESED